MRIGRTDGERFLHSHNCSVIGRWSGGVSGLRMAVEVVWNFRGAVVSLDKWWVFLCAVDHSICRLSFDDGLCYSSRGL